MVDGLVAFRTADGTKLGVAMERSVVANEADHFDADRQAGWSVLVRGRAELVTDTTLRTRLRTGLSPWRNQAERPEWVVIRPDTVTGRRL